jgi:hypothetical protein
MPRYIDGHDMLSCNKIRVHYINIDTKTNDTSKDIYEVKNLALCEDDESMLTFTWVIEAPATKYAGTLSFLIKFECTEGDDILYQWNTAKYVGTNVLVGIDNSEAFIEKYSSVLEQWYNELISGANFINEVRDQIITEIENAKEEALNEINNSDVSYYWKTLNYSGIDKTFVLDKDFRAGDEFTFEFLVANKDLIEIVYIDKKGVESSPMWRPMGEEYQKINLLNVARFVEIRVNSYVNVEHRTRIGTVQDLKLELEDLKENIESNGLPSVGGSGISSNAKSLLITILKNAVYTSDQSANINALKTALNSSSSDNTGGSGGTTEKTLASITAVYSGGNVEVGTTVSDLTGIYVTANYSDGSSAYVTDYSLSGSIVEGNNTITVSYGGKTTTFIVVGVVSDEPDEPIVPDEYIIQNGSVLTILGGVEVTQSGSVLIIS